MDELEDRGVQTPSEIFEKVKRLLEQMPNASVRDVIEFIQKEDPYVWAMMHRKLKGQTFQCDNSKLLTPEALKKLENKLKNKKKFARAKKRLLASQRPFLIDPLRDDHPHKVYMKGRQVGVSEISLIEVLWFLAEHARTKWVICFPREKNLYTFVSTRIAPALGETERMKKLVGTPNQMELKKIGDSFLVMRSSWDAALGEGIDADGLTLDEKDRMNANVEHAFKDSLSASEFGWMREISTPSLPGRGIHFQYDKSDQLSWMVRCSRCSLEQEVDWQDNIIQVKDWRHGLEIPDGAFGFLCRKQACRGKLDRLRGRWVAKFPSNKEVRGYHMPQTIFSLVSATGLMRKKFDGRTLQAWLNYEIGVPAVGDNILLTEEDYNMACSFHPLLTERNSDWAEISIGIDWGKWNWATVLGLNTNGRVYLIGIYMVQEDSEPLSTAMAMVKYIAPFSPSIIVADNGYGKDRNAYLRKVFDDKDQFWGCDYDSTPRKTKILESARQGVKGKFNPQWGDWERSGMVSVHKTVEVKKTCQIIKGRELGVPTYDTHEMQVWRKHFMNLVPMQIEDPETDELVEVIDRKGPDHLAQATNYARIGMSRLAQLENFGFAL